MNSKVQNCLCLLVLYLTAFVFCAAFIMNTDPSDFVWETQPPLEVVMTAQVQNEKEYFHLWIHPDTNELQLCQSAFAEMNSTAEHHCRKESIPLKMEVTGQTVEFPNSAVAQH